jgi:filamentous hemagglutinin family protein
MKLVHEGFAGNFGLVAKGIRRYLATTALTASGLISIASPALADNWTDHVASEGSISIDTSTPNTTNIKQNTDFVKVHGDGDINAGWTVNVAQPSSSSKYVLYDIENDPTEILGTLNANGRVYIFDQNGVIFGEGSQVNVGSIVTSTGHISDANIKQDKFIFENVGTVGEIVNKGSISVAEAGLAAFVAPTVKNPGVINAKLGKVVLASGEKVTLDLYGDDLVNIAVDSESNGALVENSGQIIAEGGSVALTVSAAKNAVDNVINMDGVVDVSSVSVKGGKIVLSGGDKGVVKVSGSLKANGKDGGKVKVTGQNIHVTETAKIEASAVTAGNGGKVDVVAANGLVFGGSISAKGGALSGNGGAVDTSGHGWVDIYGNVDASAVNGAAGSWLIDPTNLTITGAGGTNVGGNGSSGNPFAPDGDTISTLRNTVIQNALNAGTDVYITTVGTPNKPLQDGTITILANITKNAGAAATLFMEAAGSIIMTGREITATAGTTLNVAFNAAKNIFVNGSQITTGGGNVGFTAGDSIEIGALSQIRTAGGDASMIAESGNFLIGNGSAVRTAGGDITVRADGSVTTILGLPVTGLIKVLGILDAEGGDIDLHQSAVFYGDKDSVRTTGTGAITLNQNKVGLAGSLQTAIDAIENTGSGLNTVTVGAGTYKESVTVAENNFLIKGANNYNIAAGAEGRGAESVIDPNSPGFHITGDNVELNGLAITGATGPDGYGVLVEGASNAKVKNTVISGTSQDGIKVSGANGFEASDNSIDDTRGNGILVEWSNGLINILRNKIGTNATSASVDGIWGDGVEISNIDGNTFVSYNEIANTFDPTKNNTNDNSSGVYLRQSSHIVVNNNDIHDIDWDGVKLASGTGNIVQGNMIADTTRIGIYGEGTHNVSVLNNTVSNANLDTWGAITVLGGSGHTISYNDVTGPTSGADSGIHLALVSGGDNNIIGNTVHDVKGDGIVVKNVTNVNINDNIISLTKGDGIQLSNSNGALNIIGNDIGKESEDDGIEGNGIYLTQLGGAVVKGNTIWNTKASNPWDGDDASGIYLDHVGSVTVGGLGEGEANVIRNADWDGIKMAAGGSHIIQGNDISGSTRIGIYGEGTNDSTVLDNKVHDSNLVTWGGITILGGESHEIGGNEVWNDVDSTGTHGIYLGLTWGAPNSIHDNEVYNISGDGIHARQNNGDLNIATNDIDRVGSDGILVSDFETLTVDNNDVRDAGKNGFNIEYGDVVNVTNNTGLGGTANGVSFVGENGIKVGHVDEANIVNNVISWAGYDGIHLHYFGKGYIAQNKIYHSGDDGIEAHDGHWIEIDGNTIEQSGYGIILPEEPGEQYGGFDEFASGHDGIHVQNIYTEWVEGDYEGGEIFAKAPYDGYEAGSVRITDNTVNISGDDGVDVERVEGYVYIAGNTISNSGVINNGEGSNTVIHNGVDMGGADGIHVEAVVEPYYADFAGDVREGDAGNGEYNIVVYDNSVSDSLDDGVEIIGNSYSYDTRSALVQDYEGDYDYWYGNTGRVLVQGNTVSRSGWGGPSEGFGSSWNYNGADGIHVENIYPEYYGGAVGSIGGGVYAGYAVDILGNIVDRSGDDGIEVAYTSSTLIDDNTVSNSGWFNDGVETSSGEAMALVEGSGTGADWYGADGIHVRNVGNTYSYSEYPDDEVYYRTEVTPSVVPGDGYTPYSVVIRNNNVDQSQDDGIQIHNDEWGMQYTNSILIDSNENVSNSGNHGLYVSGAYQPREIDGGGRVIVSNNSFSIFDIGAEFESGLIDLTGVGNTFADGRIGLKFSPYGWSEGEPVPAFAKVSLDSTYLDLVDNDGAGSTPYPSTPTNFGGTIGSQTFTGFTEDGDFYVYLENGAFTNGSTPVWLNGLDSSYDGITPSSTGGILTQDQFNFLEARFRHYPDADASSTDIFWFGFAPDDLALIDQSDIFNYFDSFSGDITGLNVQIRGLPLIPGQGTPNIAQGLNNITTFAGGPGGTNPSDLNNIETAAGGNTTNPQNLNNIETEAGEDQSCWSNAMSMAGSGQVVNVVYGGTMNDSLSQAASCGAGF